MEVYFIPGLPRLQRSEQREPLGSFTERGIIVKDIAPASALAHEFGHACRWGDIYFKPKSGGDDEYDTLDSLLSRSDLPHDWNLDEDVGFYERGTRQNEMIPRLLMFGVSNGSQADIPRGAVYGISKYNEAGLVNVGLSGRLIASPHSL